MHSRNRRITIRRAFTSCGKIPCPFRLPGPNQGDLDRQALFENASKERREDPPRPAETTAGTCFDTDSSPTISKGFSEKSDGRERLSPTRRTVSPGWSTRQCADSATSGISVPPSFTLRGFRSFVGPPASSRSRSTRADRYTLAHVLPLPLQPLVLPPPLVRPVRRCALPGHREHHAPGVCRTIRCCPSTPLHQCGDPFLPHDRHVRPAPARRLPGPNPNDGADDRHPKPNGHLRRALHSSRRQHPPVFVPMSYPHGIPGAPRHAHPGA